MHKQVKTLYAGWKFFFKEGALILYAAQRGRYAERGISQFRIPKHYPPCSLSQNLVEWGKKHNFSFLEYTISI